jgi:hypothetical protein
MKTSELTGAALDWAVAKCEGATNLRFDTVATWWVDLNGEPKALSSGWSPRRSYTPSTNWSQGGPIIEREELSVEPQYTAGGLECWVAYGHNLRYDDHGNYIQGSDNRQYGPTPLISAMRCYVASKLGDTVDIPEELL